jgi:hypothetical protein
MRSDPEGRDPQNGPQQGPRQGGDRAEAGPAGRAPRWRGAQREIGAARRVARLGRGASAASSTSGSRVTDVVAEVLLPAEQRDEERLRALLANYERTL